MFVCGMLVGGSRFEQDLSACDYITQNGDGGHGN